MAAPGPGAKRPPTYEEMFYVTQPGLWPRLRRDVLLLITLGKTLKFWATKGRRIRAAYRQACAEGRPFVLDDNFKRMLQ